MEIFGIPHQAFMGQLLLGLVNGAFYAMLSLGLAVIFGLLDIVNFAHGALYMLGAFSAWIMLDKWGVNYWFALILARWSVGALGVIIERPFLKHLYGLDPLYGLLLTFGLSLILEGVFREQYGVSGQNYPVPELLSGATNLGFMVLPNYRAWVVVASLVVCLGTWFLIERTRLGAYLRAGTENAKLVQAFGVNVPLMVMLTYGAGAALAGLAGVLAAPIIQVTPLMGSNLIIVVFAVVVIGGMGSILGSGHHRPGPGRGRGPDARVLPGSLQRRRVRGDGHRADSSSGRPVWQGGLKHEPPRPNSLIPHHLHRIAGARAGRAPAGPVPGVRDEAAVLRAVCLCVQPAAGLYRPAVVRPCGLLRLRGLRHRLGHQDQGWTPEIGILAGAIVGPCWACWSGWWPSAARASTSP
jgi:branched-chain amino acid transport system permease protein